MRTWDYDEQGVLCSSDGYWLEYGAFGEDTYGLHMLLDDGGPCVFCLRAGYGDPAPVEKANEMLDKFEGGWRPVNWPH